LQAAAAVLLLAFGRSALMTRYGELVQRIPTEALHVAWEDSLARASGLWTAAAVQWQEWGVEVGGDALELPGTVGRVVDRWTPVSGLGLTFPQTVIIACAAILMWLVANSILLRAATLRSRVNRHPNHA
jgi:hypothetical protein